MQAKILLFGYGNPSRGDDALGPLLLQRLQEDGGFPNVEYLTDFQLQVEHALDLQGKDLVLFADAHLSCPPPFCFSRLSAETDRSYTTHAISPSAVLQVYQDIRHAPPPPAFLLGIRGERFELGEGLSEPAQQNLQAAREFASQLLGKPTVAEWQMMATSHFV